MNTVLRMGLICNCLEVAFLVRILPLLRITPIQAAALRLHGQAALRAVLAYQRVIILFGRI